MDWVYIGLYDIKIIYLIYSIIVVSPYVNVNAPYVNWLTNDVVRLPQCVKLQHAIDKCDPVVYPVDVPFSERCVGVIDALEYAT